MDIQGRYQLEAMILEAIQEGSSTTQVPNSRSLNLRQRLSVIKA